jgi:hypothetical protein
MALVQCNRDPCIHASIRAKCRLPHSTQLQGLVTRVSDSKFNVVKGVCYMRVSSTRIVISKWAMSTTYDYIATSLNSVV